MKLGADYYCFCHKKIHHSQLVQNFSATNCFKYATVSTVRETTHSAIVHQNVDVAVGTATADGQHFYLSSDMTLHTHTHNPKTCKCGPVKTRTAHTHTQSV